MPLPTPECVAGSYDQRQTLAAIYDALYTYAGEEGFDLDGLDTPECVYADDQREILTAIYSVVYLMANGS